jgi:PAS domain S-box-containing protein
VPSVADDSDARKAPKRAAFAGRSVQLTFALAFIIVLVMGALAYHSMRVSGESSRWVEHSYEVSTGLDNLMLAMTSVDASTRGFLLTGDDVYLTAWRSGASDLQQGAALVRRSTIDNHNQQMYLQTVDRLIAERIRVAEGLLALRRTQGADAAAQAFEAGETQRILTDFRQVLQSMHSEEGGLLMRRTTVAKWRLRQTKTVLIGGTALSLLITAVAGVWAVRSGGRRRLAEAARRDTEDKYRTLLDEVRDYAVLMLDVTGHVVTWNSSAARIKGYDAAQIIGEHFSCFFRREDIVRGRPEEILRTTSLCGRHEEQGVRLRKDGSQFVASITYTALKDPVGNLRGFSEITRDLSETQESGAKFRGLLEAAPDAMIVVNERGEIVLVNLQAEKQFGYRRDELLGKMVSSIVPQGFAERLIADGLRSDEDALAQQIGTGIELTGRRKDGSEFPIEIMLSPLRSSEGTLVTAAIRNITVRKEAETHLVQMENKYRGLLEAAPDAMVVVNDAGNIVLLNLQAETAFGYRRDELLGQSMSNIVPAGFPERLVADSLRSAEDALAQQIGTGIELTARRKDGSEFPIEMMLSPLASADGVLVTAAIRDITARKSSEAQLLGKVEELNRSNEELQQFAYIASHDLQEPLRMVASYTALLARRYKGKLDSDADDFIAFAADGATRMQRLIQDLLAYSRVGSKGKDLIYTSSEDALQQAMRNLRGAIEGSGALVTHDPLPSVMADEMQLTQLFQNLVGNAVKYRRAGTPRIHIAAAPTDASKWMFSVRDNGLGIESQFFERIFGVFQRLHKREEFEGTGIGLAICKKIVERHGGTISVESTLGEGSTFRFPLTTVRS